MSWNTKAASKAGGAIVPHIASGYIRTVLDRAIDGVGPLLPVHQSARAKLTSHAGDVESAASSLVRHHTALASAQGFVTNIGGLTLAAVSIPANVLGVSLVQCHMTASVAWLRGYDIEDPRVRNAILTVMLGEEQVRELVKRKLVPSSPMTLATSPVHDPALDERISKEVTRELFGRTVGRRALMFAGRKVPLLGGVVGASADGLATWTIGQYALDELRDRRRFAQQPPVV